jgi:putative transposase
MPDHVRLFVAAHSSGSPSRIANQFKGFTSRMLRREFRHLRSRLPALWSCLAATAGVVPAAMVQRCIGTRYERPWRKERGR